MKNTKFCELSSLTLVDILAALPMEHVVRMACLGHDRLRHTCSLKWVTDRMTDVTFKEALRAYQVRGDISATFCASSVMKRLNGEIKTQRIDFHDRDRINDYIQIGKQVTGRLHLNFDGAQLESGEAVAEWERFASALGALSNLTYASQTDEGGLSGLDVIEKCPGMVFDYHYSLDEDCPHKVAYRPALLNGRHIVDVLRAVCGPANISDAELDRVRREATEGAKDVKWAGKEWEGVWFYSR